MEGTASVYRVNPVSRISGEGRAEFLRTWGPDFDQKGGGRAGGGENPLLKKAASSKKNSYFKRPRNTKPIKTTSIGSALGASSE